MSVRWVGFESCAVLVSVRVRAYVRACVYVCCVCSVAMNIPLTIFHSSRDCFCSGFVSFVQQVVRSRWICRRLSPDGFAGIRGETTQQGRRVLLDLPFIVNKCFVHAVHILLLCKPLSLYFFLIERREMVGWWVV